MNKAMRMENLLQDLPKSKRKLDTRVKVTDLIKIIEKIIIEKNNPIIPKDVAISK